ncbi:TetR family transcriptional regulator [Asanoa ishikariensis]|uniref:Transcriptional regulator, TetR family n=1 Tax=Asanoa ishikariensis TaxID=137265 RepID=A0A1H3M2I9_9ACTN|nr:TetR/AcrR family transcriptional regulator [Asanoa ishikariensis]GIF65833.1 TetR family transcriptional regulator [Asanoa ishikariensis]SDY70235.1 transcriptional regulator, TetR family [Asanoa ishikariensis]
MPDLPPGVDVLWGRREPAKRGPRPNLSIEQIVDAAIEIASAEGLGPLSMNRVAEKLGKSAMSLYRYVRTKDELLQLMTDVSAVKHPPPEPDETEGWRPNLERWAYALVGLYRQFPWVLNVPLGPTPPVGPGQLTWLDRGLASFRKTHVPSELRLGVVMLLLIFIRGQVRMAQEVNQGAAGVALGYPAYGEMLRLVVDKDQLPDLARLVDEGLFDDPEEGMSEQEFDLEVRFGLTMIFDGIERLVAGYEEEQ